MIQIYYKIVGVATWVKFFDDTTGNQSMPQLGANGKNLTEVTPGFGAANQAVTPMGNALVDIKWKFHYTYASAGAALLALMNLQNAISGQSIHLQIVVTSTTSGTYYYPNCSVDAFNYDLQGCSLEIDLEIKGNQLTNVQPTT